MKPARAHIKYFLKNYRISKSGKTVFIPHKPGFLRLEYDDEYDPPLLARIAFTVAASEHARPVGKLLELTLTPDGQDDRATFISEEGVSGTQWADGAVRWGHTYEDDSPQEEGRRISLDDWVEECLDLMTGGEGKVRAARAARYDCTGDIDLIRDGDEDARDRFWKNCSPGSEAEVGPVLDLLARAIRDDDGDLLFACADPLKRATAGQARILDEVTSLLEGKCVPKDYDRSELQEVLKAHAARPDNAVAERWLALCEDSFEEKGPDALHAIHEGALFDALLAAPRPPGGTAAFLRRVLDRVKMGEGDDAGSLAVLKKIRKAVRHD